MSHNWNCPDDYEARRQARDDASFDLRYGNGRYDYRNPYDCDEGNESYQREYRYEAERLEEERAQERRAERRREKARQEDEYWAEQQAAEDAMRAEEEAYWAEQYAAQWIGAGTAETVEQGSVHESPVAKPCAQPEDTPQ